MGPRYGEAPQYGQRLEDHDVAAHHQEAAYASLQHQYPDVHTHRQGEVSGRRRSLFPRATEIPVTWTLIAVCTVVYILQWLVPQGVVTQAMLYAPVLTEAQPWRMLTSGFVHSPNNIAHVVLNMYTLFLFGQALEPRMGWWRHLTVYLLSILGGSAAVWLLANPWTPVVGASGGVFGLFGALFVWTRFHGGDTRALVALVVINMVFSFVFPGISWQAHVGGLITGAVVAWVFELCRRGSARQRRGTAQRL